MALELAYKSVMNVASKAFKKSLAGELNKVGLRYEDLLNSSKPAIAEALELADPEVLHGRMRRLKRASDLCVKQKRYIDYAEPRPLEEVFQEDLLKDVDKLQARNDEMELLNLHKK